MRSLYYHTKAWRRRKDIDGIAVEGDLFLETKIDFHNYLRVTIEEQPMSLCDEDGDERLELPVFCAKRKMTFIEFVTGLLPKTCKSQHNYQLKAGMPCMSSKANKNTR